MTYSYSSTAFMNLLPSQINYFLSFMTNEIIFYSLWGGGGNFILITKYFPLISLGGTNYFFMGEHK